MNLPCNHTDPERRWGLCSLCRLFETDIKYRKAWGGDDNVKAHLATPRNKITTKPIERKQCGGCGQKQSPPIAPPGTTIVEHGAGGIGDGLLGLCAVAKLKQDNPTKHVQYKVSRTAKPFVELFGGYDSLDIHSKAHSEEPVAGAMQLNIGYAHENQTGYQVPRWQRYCKNIGVSSCITPKLKKRDKLFLLGARYKDAVILSPHSTDRTREWSLHHWLTLEDLLKNAGYRVLVATRNNSDRFRCEKLVNASAEELTGAMLNSRCVIGTDSGLTHLAGIVDAPTIVLGGSTPVARIFPYASCRFIQGGLLCSGCGGGTGIDNRPWVEERCKYSCSNLQVISPERVLAEVDSIWLKDNLTKDKSLVDDKRLAVIRDCILSTNHLGGDLAELGVFMGGVSKLLGHYAPDARIHCFDTFAGIPEDDTAPGGHVKGEMACNLDSVKRYLDNPNVIYHVGKFPDTAPDDSTRYRFVHLDGDTYQTTAAALDYFAPRMVQGGIIVIDDYGWWKCGGVALALHERYHESRVIKTKGGFQAMLRF